MTIPSMPGKAKDELLSQRSVAERLDVSTRTVRRWVSEGRLPSVRLGARAIRIPAAAVRDFVVAGERRCAPESLATTTTEPRS